MRRRPLLKPILCAALLAASATAACGAAPPSPPAAAASAREAGWPAWTAFSRRFLQADGRVVDLTFGGKSTSEGQSYGLFFALVANRRDQFDLILKWTSDNLAAGQLGTQLPAWLWGEKADGAWGIKDANPASDADLWLAYTLLEAGRLWGEARYTVLGRQLLSQVAARETVQAGAAGTLLLPGPYGFALSGGRYRLNPSYLPGFMFRRLAAVDPAGPWQAIWDSYLRMAPAVFAAGVAPDTFVVDRDGRAMPDTEQAPSGSYDAIRVYLWAGMSGRSANDVLGLLPTYAVLIRRDGQAPEKVDPRSGVAVPNTFSPIGFAGAVLPYLKLLGDERSLAAQRERVTAEQRRAAGGAATQYYDQALILFGEGWLAGRYAFGPDGQLVPQWQR